jgi:hypothetical protein
VWAVHSRHALKRYSTTVPRYTLPPSWPSPYPFSPCSVPPPPPVIFLPQSPDLLLYTHPATVHLEHARPSAYPAFLLPSSRSTAKSTATNHGACINTSDAFLTLGLAGVCLGKGDILRPLEPFHNDSLSTLRHASRFLKRSRFAY